MNFIGLVDADDKQTSLDISLVVLQKKIDACLKDKFFSVRASFTRAYHNWTHSGQNNPERTDFVKFVPSTPSSTAICSLDFHCLILFYAMKFGTEEEDVEVLNLTSTMVPFEVGYDDREDEIAETPCGGDSRKHEQVFNEVVGERKVRNKNVSELVSTVKTMISGVNTNIEGARKEESLCLEEVLKLMKQVNELLQMEDRSHLFQQYITITEAALQRAQGRRASFLQE